MGGEPANAASYKVHLQARSAEVAALDVLVRGISDARNVEGAAPQDVVAALGALDALADAPLPQPDLDKKVRDIVAAVPRGASALGRPRAPSEDRPETFQELTVRVETLSNVVWGVFLLLTVAVGAYAVVLNNKAFGSPFDYLLCLFWGFGLPAGAQLLTATPGTVSQAFGIAVPK